MIRRRRCRSAAPCGFSPGWSGVPDLEFSLFLSKRVPGGVRPLPGPQSWCISHRFSRPRWRQDGFQDGPRRPRWRIMLPCGLQYGRRWPIMAIKMPPRWPKQPPRRPRRHSRRSKKGPKRQKSLKNLWFFYDYHDSSSYRHGGSRSHSKSPMGAPRRPKIAPRRPKMAPRWPQDGP